MESIQRLKSAPGDGSNVDPSEVIVAQMREEIRNDEATAQALLKERQESMPEHQRFLNYLDEREHKSAQIRTMQDQLSKFDILSRSQKTPVAIPAFIPEPT